MKRVMAVIIGMTICLASCISSDSSSGTAASTTKLPSTSRTVSKEALAFPLLDEGVYDVSSLFGHAGTIFYDKGLWLCQNIQEGGATILPFHLTPAKLETDKAVKISYENAGLTKSVPQVSGNRVYVWTNRRENGAQVQVYDMDKGLLPSFKDGEKRYEAFCPDTQTGESVLTSIAEEKQQFYLLDLKGKLRPWFSVNHQDIAFLQDIAKGTKGLAFRGGAYKVMGQQSENCYGFIDSQGHVTNKVFREAMDCTSSQNGLIIFDGSPLRGEEKYALGRFIFLDGDTLTASEFVPETAEECREAPALSVDKKFLLTSVQKRGKDGTRLGYTFRVYDVATKKRMAKFHLDKGVSGTLSLSSAARSFLFTFYDETLESPAWKTYLYQF